MKEDKLLRSSEPSAFDIPCSVFDIRTFRTSRFQNVIFSRIRRVVVNILQRVVECPGTARDRPPFRQWSRTFTDAGIVAGRTSHGKR